MQSTDPRIQCERLHNQDVFVPTPEAWRDILRDGELDGLSVPIPGWIAGWLAEYSGFAMARLGIVLLRGRWLLIPLLYTRGKYFRVHFEDVICEHCGSRCGPSAQPDTTLFAGTGLTTAQVWAEFDELPVHRCPHCDGILRRRQTIWLARAVCPQPEPGK
jgi:hypothetical protein